MAKYWLCSAHCCKNAITVDCYFGHFCASKSHLNLNCLWTRCATLSSFIASAQIDISTVLVLITWRYLLRQAPPLPQSSAAPIHLHRGTAAVNGSAQHELGWHPHRHLPRQRTVVTPDQHAVGSEQVSRNAATCFTDASGRRYHVSGAVNACADTCVWHPVLIVTSYV